MFNNLGCFGKGCLGIFVCVLVFVLVVFWSASGSSEPKTQPFEVETKTGKVTLHLGMPKDSVILLLGEPDESEAHSFGSDIINDIGYKVKDKGYADLTFRFENGKLESFRQN